MSQHPKVVISYLSYHSEPYFERALEAISKLTYPKDKLALLVVDNPHVEYGNSTEFIENTVNKFSKDSLPEVVKILPQEKNLGFSGGHNVAMRWAIENDYDYVYLNNSDGYLDAGAIEPLVNSLEADRNIGAMQSLVLLHPEENIINTAGNIFHYLGLSYSGHYREDINKVEFKPVEEVNSLSGAAVMLRVDLLREYGLWDEDFFLYHEDFEYSLRLKMLGYKLALASRSKFYHQYEFERSIKKFYWMERNRYGVLLMFYKLPTIILLLPMFLVLEFGLLFFSLFNGWFGERLKVYGYWLRGSSWKLWLGKRKHIQEIRKIDDKDFLNSSSATIEFVDIDSLLLRKFANPMMSLYYSFIIRFINW